MYKVMTKEDTIRIPAEYMRKGQSLDQHIDRLSMGAFEGKFDAENRFVLVTNNHKTIGRGRIIHGDGAIYQRVQFDAVLFCMDDQEVVEGAVSEVNEFGAFVRIGPMEALLHKSQIMDEPVDINIGANKITGRQTGREAFHRFVCTPESFRSPRTPPTLVAQDWPDEQAGRPRFTAVGTERKW